MEKNSPVTKIADSVAGNARVSMVTRHGDFTSLTKKSSCLLRANIRLQIWIEIGKNALNTIEYGRAKMSIVMLSIGHDSKYDTI